MRRAALDFDVAAAGPVIPEVNKRLYCELGNGLSNLNQIAKQLNTAARFCGGDARAALIAKALDTLDETIEEAKKFLNNIVGFDGGAGG